MTLHGPYYRTGERQSDATTALQRESSEIHGKADWGSDRPSVDAWVGRLPATRPGIEFFTEVAPDAGCPPGRGRWSGRRPGVTINGDTAIIKAVITAYRFRK